MGTAFSLSVLSPRRLRNFLAQEEGQISIFTMMLFFMILAFSGMAVDMMRHENARTKLQQTLDRAILAAASIKQVRDPDIVVEDYFRAADMLDQLVDVQYDESINFNDVSAIGRVPVYTFFMSLLDIDVLNAGAIAAAQEGVGNIEISLVLDISGSMRFGDQIGKLRVASKNFFAQMLEGDAKDTTSINIVPYAGHVNIGRRLFEEFGGVRVHENSSCLELSDADYLTAAPPAVGLAQVPHFMKWDIDNATMNWGWCPMDDSDIIIAENDKAKLDAFITNVRLHDGTGTMTGVKYGLMLLNPALQGVFAELAEENLISDDFSDRPKAWASSVGSDNNKYLIIMTDGNITEQFRPKYSAFRDPDKNNLDDEVYDKVADPDKVDGTDHVAWNATVELDKQPAANRSSSPLTSRNTNLARFYAQCEFAKKNNVTVFTIAFNAPAEAQTEMRNCASSGSNYYYVPSGGDGNGLNNAFMSISRTIKQLRLTQ
jgi:hypothetical protein